MKNSMLQYLKPLATVIVNLLLAYAVYFVSRIVFFLENHSLYSDSLDSLSHVSEMLYGGMVFDTTAILYTNSLWVLLVLFPLWRKETPSYHNFCKWLFVSVNTLALAVNLCDAVYFRFSMRRTTTTVFQEFSNEDNIAGIMLKEAVSHWYFFLLAAVVAWLLSRLYLKPCLDYRNLGWKPHAAAMLLSLSAFLPFCIAGMRGGWSRTVRPITISNANDYCNKPTEAALVLNTPFSLIRTIGKNLFEPVKFYPTPEELSAVYTPLHQPLPGKMPTGKNVVVIIAESFGCEYIGFYNPLPSGGSYTPFLDSLIANSLSFTHSFCNGRKSIDGMPSVLSGIPMFVEPYFLSPYSNNKVEGLACCLGRKGYETAFFHGSKRGSMGLMSFARATKFENYYGREDFNADSRTNGDREFDGWWGISDEPFLQYMNLKLSEMKQPFVASVFTLSSHHPFIVPDKYKEQFNDGLQPIHNVIRYADNALRLFFEKARTQEWFANTLFVITADHTNTSYVAEFGTDLGGFRVPVIFYDPSGEIKSEVRKGIAQQTDIMPTVLNHLGYDEPYVAFGKDLLDTPADSTWAVNYLNGVYQYVKYGYLLQFDGKSTRAVYSLDDLMLRNNLKGRVPCQQQMENELKAIIQQYMERMTTDRLVP